MIKKIDKFLKNFEEKSISIKELSEKISVHQNDLEDLLSDYKKYSKSKELKYFYITNDYYINGVKSSGRFAYLNKSAVAKPTSIKNLYFKDEKTKGNIYLTGILKGEKVYKGNVDKSDIGGLFSSVFTIHGEYGSEIEDYSKYPLEKLCDFFPLEIFTICKSKENVNVKIEERGISSTANSFFYAFIDCIKKLSKVEDFYITQIREIYEGNTEKYPFAYSPIFYNIESLTNWDNQTKEYKDTKRINKKQIKTN